MPSFALRYDPGIPSVMPMAVGCLTMKKECDAWLFLHDASLFLLTLVTFSYFLLLFFTGGKLYSLLFTGEKGKVCYFLLLFLLLVIFMYYFLPGQEG
jgi:hypothetical protein